MSLKSGDYNDLTIPNTQVQQMVEKSLAQSGCFIQSEQISAETTNTQKNHYQLEVVFGNINTQTKQGGFGVRKQATKLFLKFNLISIEPMK